MQGRCKRSHLPLGVKVLVLVAAFAFENGAAVIEVPVDDVVIEALLSGFCEASDAIAASVRTSADRWVWLLDLCVAPRRCPLAATAHRRLG